jgi:hypothetical protein
MIPAFGCIRRFANPDKGFAAAVCRSIVPKVRDQGWQNVGGMSRGRRSRPRRTEPWRRFSAGTHTDLLGAGFLLFIILYIK